MILAYMSTVPHSAGQSRIFIRCPAFFENGIVFFSLPIMLHFCLAMQQSDELRIKIGSKFARLKISGGGPPDPPSEAGSLRSVGPRLPLENFSLS